MKVSSPILPILSLKSIAMTTYLERSEKDSHIPNLRSNIYQHANFVKIGPVDPEIICLN